MRSVHSTGVSKPVPHLSKMNAINYLINTVTQVTITTNVSTHQRKSVLSDIHSVLIKGFIEILLLKKVNCSCATLYLLHLYVTFSHHGNRITTVENSDKIFNFVYLLYRRFCFFFSFKLNLQYILVSTLLT